MEVSMQEQPLEFIWKLYVLNDLVAEFWQPPQKEQYLSQGSIDCMYYMIENQGRAVSFGSKWDTPKQGYKYRSVVENSPNIAMVLFELCHCQKLSKSVL